MAWSTRGAMSRARASRCMRLGAPGPTLKCSVVMWRARARRAIRWPTTWALMLWVTTMLGSNRACRSARLSPATSARCRIRAQLMGIPSRTRSWKKGPWSLSVRHETSKPRLRTAGIRIESCRSAPPTTRPEQTNKILAGRPTFTCRYRTLVAAPVRLLHIQGLRSFDGVSAGERLAQQPPQLTLLTRTQSHRNNGAAPSLNSSP
jgi:hypothetical protein